MPLMLAACLTSLLGACAPAALSSTPADTRRAPDADTAAACPAATFDAFLERFDREIAFQKLATADPLVSQRYDTAAEPEPRLVIEQIPRADVVWPVMPRLDTLPARQRSHEIRRTSEDRVEVRIRGQDTSDQQTYVFGRSPCWQLQRVLDDSI